MFARCSSLFACALTLSAALSTPATAAPRKLLYVATPGVRDYLEYGGHGILVFDIEDHHKFLKRIPSAGLDKDGKPLNVKGICANEKTGRLYVSTTQSLMSFDLETEKMLWEKKYEGGCDRMAITPDGRTIYLPSLEKEHWHAIDAISGDVIKKIVLNSGAHNTIVGPDGRYAYLAGLKSPLLRVVDTSNNEVAREIGPFGNVIRPFTIDGRQTRCYVNVNELLGFEIGDLKSGKVLARVEIAGFEKGPPKRHGCPSHGIALTVDGSELWVTDAYNNRMHIYDTASLPPKKLGDIRLRDQPGWITFSIDGKLAYPSTGDVIDVKTRKIIAELTDEKGTAVQSEKLLEIDMDGTKAFKAGNQFGLSAP